jgi:triosephosphate isomerase
MENKKYFFANWKMYLNYSESIALAEGIKNINFSDKLDVAAFPSALSFYGTQQVLNDSRISTGAQNIGWVEKGGYTGEVSGMMYKEVGAKYALIGHSERRHLFGETNHEVRQKIESALSADLIPVLCIGETEAERERGKTIEVLEIQIQSALEGLDFLNITELFVAYEPVWAISKGIKKEEQGKFCDPSEAEQNSTFIKNFVKKFIPENVSLSVLFGGSVRPSTIESYISQPDIDGVLVGAASTTIDGWSELVSQIH